MASLDFHAMLKEERRKAKEAQDKAREASSPAITQSSAPAQSAAVQPVDFPPFRLDPRPALDMVVHSVGEIPTVRYLPAWITEEEEQSMLEQTYAPAASGAWVQLSGRRLQCWGGRPEDKENFRPEPLPPWLRRIAQCLVEAGVFPPDMPPNHVLLNEYRRGQGILPHTDGLYYHPLTATLSLGGSAIMTFSPRIAASAVGTVASVPSAEVLLRPRSVVVFTDEAYTDYLHAIAECESETVGGVAPAVNLDTSDASLGDEIYRPSIRLSLTFRFVPCNTGDDGGEPGEKIR